MSFTDGKAGEPKDVTPGDRDAYPTSDTFETGDNYIGIAQSDLGDGSFQTVHDLLEADCGPLLGSGGIFAQTFY